MSSFNDTVEICEQLLLSIAECFVYKIPPLRNASGHRAEEWDLANPIITGCSRIYQSDETLRVVIYSIIDNTSANRTDDNIKLFAECIIPGLKDYPNSTMSSSLPIYINAVIDSSRYYVLRCVNKTTKQIAMIGIGFRYVTLH